MEEMTQAVNAATTPLVQMWMNWMLLVFAVSILFAWKFKPARYVLLAWILSMPLAFLIFKMTGNPWLLGLSHLLWVPLAAYLIFGVIKKPGFKVGSISGIWLVLLLATITISLVFDVRDIFLVFTQQKGA